MHISHVSAAAAAAIFGPGRWGPKSYSICCSCCYQFSKNPQGFLNTQCNETAHTFVLTFPTDLLSQIFKLILLMSNYQSSFHVIDLKLDIEPALIYCQRSACSGLLQQDARWSVVMNIYAQARLTVSI